MEDIYQDFWGAFLEQTGRPETTVMTDVTYFGGSEEESVTILEQLHPVYVGRDHRPHAGDPGESAAKGVPGAHPGAVADAETGGEPGSGRPSEIPL